MSEPPSVGSVLTDVADDVGRLVRQEVELARAEIAGEARKATRAVRALIGGGFALLLVGVLVSIAAVVALAVVLSDRLRPELVPYAPAIAAGALAVCWLVVAVVLLSIGRRRLRSLSPIPRKTIASLKEDLAWLRRPTA